MFSGDSLPSNINLEQLMVLIEPWRPKHTPDIARPFVDRTVEGLKRQGVTSFAAVGYCYGGRIVFDLAFDNVIKVAAAAHPSLLKVPEHLEVRP